MSNQPQRAFSTAFKESVVLRLEAGGRLAAVADELGIRRALLHESRNAYRRPGGRRVEPQAGSEAGRQKVEFAAGRALPVSPSGPDGAPVIARPGGELGGELGDERARAKARLAELERVIGRRQVDLVFFRRALRLMDASAQSGVVRVKND
jgi:transposase-like protein